MIKLYRKIISTILFLAFTATAFCQTGSLPGDAEKVKPDDKSNSGVSSIKIGINYSNNNVFMGRADTVRTTAIIPQVKYTLASGIYFSASLNVLPQQKKKKLDGGDISAGYNVDITDDLSAGASYSKLFYNKASTQVASSISSTFNANLSYDFGDLLTTALSADYNLNTKGSNNDIFLNLGISHDFMVNGVFGDSDLLLVSPTITLNTGTENFYDSYLQRKNIKNTKRAAAENKVIAQYTSQLSQYKILDYELSIPAEYKTGSFIFQFTPTYAVVGNKLPNVISARLSDSTSIFYFETGVALKF